MYRKPKLDIRNTNSEYGKFIGVLDKNIDSIQENNKHIDIEDRDHRFYKNTHDNHTLSPLKNHGQSSIALGLPNLGNTCYMNSVLQCLFNTPQLMNYFNSQSQLFGSKSLLTLCTSFINLYDVIQDNESSAKELESYVSSVKNGIESVASRFRGTIQQDAYDFLRVLLDALHAEFNKLKKPKLGVALTPFRYDEKKEISKVIAEWNEFNTAKDDTIVTKLFGSTVLSQVECSVCRTVNYSFQNTLDFCLPLNKKKNSYYSNEAIDILDGLNEEFLVDIIARDVPCSRCKARGGVVKRNKLVKAAEILIIQLKRFDYDERTNSQKKNENKAKFPVKNFNLKPYFHKTLQSKDYLYNLYAIVNHKGMFSSGHYTAQCYSRPFSTWQNYDDISVKDIKSTVIDEYQKLGNEYPYVLFYQKC